MPANMVLIRETTLNASAASVTFSSIPQTGYTDLKVVVSARSDRVDTSDNIIISFNGSTANLSYRYLQGSGASATSSSGSTGYVGTLDGNTATSNTFGNAEIYIPNYTGSTFKSVSSDSVDETNATNAYATLTATLWSNTAAITSINLKPQVGSNFVAGSTFSLYGIAAFGTTPTVVPHASGGDVITNDGTYWIHQFYSSGTFIPNKALNCDYLVVAGGGGGGSDQAGGGGGGGYRSGTSTFAASTNYSCTVGGGGAGGAALSGNTGTQGSSSVLDTITSAGGGFGSGYGANVAGGNGGSGGGAAGLRILAGGTGNTPSTSPSQGNNGGQTTATNHRGAGGGGAGGAGSSGGTTSTGAGGAGASSSISGTSVSRAGGGSGGGFTGDTIGAVSGGGGAGSTTNGGAGSAATVNTGGGGGGGPFNAGAGGAGGSGIVIIRYPIN